MAELGNAPEWQPIVAGDLDFDVQNLSLMARLAFISKVYRVLMAVLFVNMLMSIPFVFDEAGAKSFLNENSFIIWFLCIVLLCMLLFHMCVYVDVWFGDDIILLAYLKIFKSEFGAMCYLFVFAIATSVMLGAIGATYGIASVCFVFWLEFAIVVSIFVWSMVWRPEFDNFTGYNIVIGVGLLIGLILCLLIKVGSLYGRVLATALAIVWGLIIVYDSQLIFGIRSKGSCQGSKYSYTPDLSSYAALDTYLDIVNFFLQGLQVFGGRREN